MSLGSDLLYMDSGDISYGIRSTDSCMAPILVWLPIQTILDSGRSTDSVWLRFSYGFRSDLSSKEPATRLLGIELQ